MSILNYDGPKAESAGQLCKPDPEKMIELANKRKQHYVRAVLILEELDEIPLNLETRGSDDYFLKIYGAAHAGIRKCEKDIQRWMDEIDSGK